MKAKILAPAAVALVAIVLAMFGGINGRNARAEQDGKASVGRFQISACSSSSGGIRACFVVDTTTGELWHTELTNDGQTGLRKWNKIADGVPVSK